jgi:hypothetical protein
MKIRTERTPVGDWYAIDNDTYDGAPDAGRAGAMGWGKSEQDAIADLLDQRGTETPTSAIRDFLMAVDRGYLGTLPSGFNDSAFVKALRAQINSNH